MPIRNSVLRSVAAKPWSSAQDALLGVSVLAIAGLLAIEGELFRFAGEMPVDQQRISLIEAILLTLLLGLCVAAFIHRRVREIELDTRTQDELAKLRDEALRDPLTGLPNRRAIMSGLASLEDVEKKGTHALLLLDLNEFKQVNDEYGHTVGDRVLQVIAERFRRISRPTDLLARLGGDEFAILAYDVDRAGAATVGSRFIATMQNEVVVAGVRQVIGVSIGAVLIPEDAVTADELIGKADLAMYSAKAEGRSAFAFYDASMGHWDPGEVTEG